MKIADNQDTHKLRVNLSTQVSLSIQEKSKKRGRVDLFLIRIIGDQNQINTAPFSVLKMPGFALSICSSPKWLDITI